MQEVEVAVDRSHMENVVEWTALCNRIPYPTMADE